MRVRGYPDLLVNKVLAEVQFTNREFSSETKNAQEDIAVCYKIQSIPAKPKEHLLNAKMAFNRKSTFAERNLLGSTNFILQERKIFKRHNHRSQTLKVEYITWTRPAGVLLGLSTLQNKHD